MEPFITTYTGRKVNPLNLKPSDICIEDIAHHLACLNRFVGASFVPISVAQHSVHVSELVDGKGCELEALLHDATEAYLGDVSKWVKQDPAMAAYRDAEDRAWTVIASVFNLPIEMPSSIEVADRLMVRVEAFYSWHDKCHLFALSSHPQPTEEELNLVPWCPWNWREAEHNFLRRFRVLSVKHTSCTTSGRQKTA